MTKVQKMQKEIDAFNAKRIADKKALMADSGAPTAKRTFTYRPTGQM